MFCFFHQSVYNITILGQPTLSILKKMFFKYFISIIQIKFEMSKIVTFKLTSKDVNESNRSNHKTSKFSSGFVWSRSFIQRPFKNLGVRIIHDRHSTLVKLAVMIRKQFGIQIRLLMMVSPRLSLLIISTRI